MYNKGTDRTKLISFKMLTFGQVMGQIKGLCGFMGIIFMAKNNHFHSMYMDISLNLSKNELTFTKLIYSEPQCVFEIEENFDQADREMVKQWPVWGSKMTISFSI